MMKRWLIISLILIVIPVIFMSSKIVYWGYDILDVIPEKGYKLTLEISTNNKRPKAINISTFAPVNNIKQQVLKEESMSDIYNFKVVNKDNNRLIQWTSGRVLGKKKIRYMSKIKSIPVKFNFDQSTFIKKSPQKSFQRYLIRTDLIQVDSKLIIKKTEELTKDKHTFYDKIQSIHQFLVNKIKYKNFSGGLDAESSLQLQEASCNGKSRLYVAMVRSLGVPARVVGGIILNKSPKKVIHQWVEIYINGMWVPFCPTNGFFAELPRKYITLYYNDEVLIKRTSMIDFDYMFKFESITIPKIDLSKKFKDLPINIFAIMDSFEKFNISLNILTYLLMLPIAAVIAMILRNVIGLETFGTFLPILIASAMQGTGLFLGLATFLGIIFLVYFVDLITSKLELLYHPKMAILLSSVIFVIISVFFISTSIKNYDLINIIYFPVAIIAITVNRVFIVLEEEGIKKLSFVTINTVLVILICYYFINSTFLQLTMLSFPELILFLIGINILIGRWAGLRLTEFFRFKNFY